MHSSRPVLGPSRSANIDIQPIIQPAPRMTLKTIPKISMTTIWTHPCPSGKENLPSLHPPQRRRRIPSAAYSSSPGDEYTVPARSRVVPPPPPPAAITKPGRSLCSESVPWAQTGKALTPSPPPSTPTPSTPPPSPSPPSSPRPTPKLSPPPLPLTGLRSMTTARLAVRDIVLADDVRWTTTIGALDDLHSLDSDPEGEYWMWRADEFQLRARAKAEWKKHERCNYSPPYTRAAANAKTKPDSYTPPYERGVDEPTMASFFNSYNPDNDYDLYAYSESEPIFVYPLTIPTPAEKSFESWLSSDDDAESDDDLLSSVDQSLTGGSVSESFRTAYSSPSPRSMQDSVSSETSYSLQVSDVSAAPYCDPADSPVELSLQDVYDNDVSSLLANVSSGPYTEYPHTDIFTYESTFEKETRESRERSIARLKAMAQAVGPTCDDVDEADYSDGSPSESGLTAFADDEASSQSEVSSTAYSADGED